MSHLLFPRFKRGPNWMERPTKVQRYCGVLPRLIKRRPLGCIRGLFASDPGAFAAQACQLGPVCGSHLRSWQPSGSEATRGSQACFQSEPMSHYCAVQAHSSRCLRRRIPTQRIRAFGALVLICENQRCAVCEAQIIA